MKQTDNLNYVRSNSNNKTCVECKLKSPEVTYSKKFDCNLCSSCFTVKQIIFLKYYKDK